MGARVRFEAARANNPIRLDIEVDRNGEIFKIEALPETEIMVSAAAPKDRHLVLLARLPAGDRTEKPLKFLCGHDERHWFVAALPGGVAGTVSAARQALKPASIRGLETTVGMKASARLRRHNPVSVRQGEWFFIPSPDVRVDELLVLKNEPISRGAGSKPHRVQFLYRETGETVWVSRSSSQVLSEREYARLVKQNPKEKRKFQVSRRVTSVYAKGWVRHPDHATVILRDWHRVELNTEGRAPGVSRVAFLD